MQEVIHYVLRITDLWKNCHSSGWNVSLYVFIKIVINLVVITEGYYRYILIRCYCHQVNPEEQRLRVLRRLYGPKRGEVTGWWRRPRNEELHNLYASPNILQVIRSRRMRCERHVAHVVEMRNEYKILVGKPEGKRILGRRWHRWEGNIRMNHREIGWDVVDWMCSCSGYGPMADSCEHGNEPSKGGEFLD
jgi:hypothetical protein